MKKVSLLFLISFSFFVLGQFFWSIKLIIESPLLGTGYIDDWVVNIIFCFEIIIYAVENNKAFGGCAGLSAVHQPALRACFNGFIKIF